MMNSKNTISPSLVAIAFLASTSTACASSHALYNDPLVTTDDQLVQQSERNADTMSSTVPDIMFLEETREEREFAYCSTRLDIISNDPHVNREFCSMAYFLHTSFEKYNARNQVNTTLVMK